MQKYSKIVSNFVFLISIFFIVYMPLHVFIAQSASLVTGGLDVWKAAKDVLVFVSLPALLWLAWRQGLFQQRLFRILTILGVVYGFLHGVYLLFDADDHTFSTIVASTYNTRLLVYFLLGYLVATSKHAKTYSRYLLTATVLIASAVAMFGVAQYFLPPDLLENVGYSVERGVKPLFFIDDKPDLPRIMSTLRDPNSFGAYLIVPLLITATALFKQKANKELFVRPFRASVLVVFFVVQFAALVLTFSRGAAIAFALSVATAAALLYGRSALVFARRFAPVLLVFFVLCAGVLFAVRDSYVVQNVIFHADESTVLEDPNELRVRLQGEAIESIIDRPLGHGPGSAGLVAISNPQGGVLTENYYLQIAYEVGWLGVTIFIAILFVLAQQLYKASKGNSHDATHYLAMALLASLIGYAFYSLLIHLWSNEAIALQWWLLTGVCVGSAVYSKTTTKI